MASSPWCWTRGDAAVSEALLVPGARGGTGRPASCSYLEDPAVLEKTQGRFGDTLWGSRSPAQVTFSDSELRVTMWLLVHVTFSHITQPGLPRTVLEEGRVGGRE